MERIQNCIVNEHKTSHLFDWPGTGQKTSHLFDWPGTGQKTSHLFDWPSTGQKFSSTANDLWPAPRKTSNGLWVRYGPFSVKKNPKKQKKKKLLFFILLLKKTNKKTPNSPQTCLLQVLIWNALSRCFLPEYLSDYFYYLELYIWQIPVSWYRCSFSFHKKQKGISNENPHLFLWRNKNKHQLFQGEKRPVELCKMDK